MLTPRGGDEIGVLGVSMSMMSAKAGFAGFRRLDADRTFGFAQSGCHSSSEFWSPVVDEFDVVSRRESASVPSSRTVAEAPLEALAGQ